MSLLATVAAWPVRFYRRFLSPLKPPTCRFHPTCSEYALDALREHGFFKGCLLTLWRLLRCQPLCRGGYDPVPEPGRWRPAPPAPAPDPPAAASDRPTDSGERP